MRDSVAGIDYRFKDPRLLEQALTHRSVGAHNYERLEFLGDSVISLVISCRLFERHPEAPEGDLSRMRARLVRGASLGEIASGIGLDWASFSVARIRPSGRKPIGYGASADSVPT